VLNIFGNSFTVETTARMNLDISFTFKLYSSRLNPSSMQIFKILTSCIWRIFSNSIF